MSQELSSQNNDNNKDDWERTFEMFKLEYVQAAQRYENIYKAIWQIFQYMALLAGGILTFASKSDQFPTQAIIFIALTPLIFWFLAIYLPMNRYGKNTRENLVNIEKKINDKSEKKYWEITHFTDSDQQIPEKPKWLLKLLRFFNSLQWPEWLQWRVTQAIVFCGICILFLWGFFLYETVIYYPNYTSQVSSAKIKLELKPVELNLSKTQIKEFKQSLDSLTTKIDLLESLMKETTANNLQQPPQ